MGFTASLHPLSLAGAFRAAVLRTPQRIAVVEGSRAVTYAELMAAVQNGAPDPSGMARWLASERASEAMTENPRHRALLLRAFDNVVEYAAFDRDDISASTLPLDTPVGAVAATVSLVLGATLYLVDAEALAEGVAAGRFQTCWLRPGETTRTEWFPPAVRFRLALCDGSPTPDLIHWLGPQRVAEAI